MGWANRITVLRAILTLVLWGLLAWIASATEHSKTAWWVAFGLFVFTAMTDMVDGIIARRLGEVSVFGRIADPLVDKLLVLGTMVMLLGTVVAPRPLPAWAVTLMFARELVVTVLRGAVEGRGISFQAMPLGKAKMLAQSIGVAFVIAYGAGAGPARWHLGADGPSVTEALIWIATLLTVVSGVDYALRASRLLRRD